MIKKIVILIFAIVLFNGCAIYHHYGPYYGKVVDSETEQPLEGAGVVVLYYTKRHTVAGEIGKLLHVQETVTNKNGNFSIPSTNQITLRLPISSFKPDGRIYIFKPGYGCYPEHKDVKPMFVPNGTLPQNTNVLIQLPALASRREREINLMCGPNGIPYDNYRRFMTIVNDERTSLGFEPIPLN